MEKATTLLAFKKKLAFSFLTVVVGLLILEITVAFVRTKTEKNHPGLLSHSPVISADLVAKFFGEKDVQDQIQVLSDRYYIFDATLGYRFRPSSWAYGLQADDEGYPKIAEDEFLAVDPMGFIANKSDTETVTPYGELAENPNVLRILASGASTTTGWGSSSCEYSWPAILERLLNENIENIHGPEGQRYDRAVVINSSVFGYNLSQEVKRFAEETVYFNPSIVISLNGLAEIWSYEGNPVDYATKREQRLMSDTFNFGTSFARPIFFPYLRQAIYDLTSTSPDTSESIYGFRHPAHVRVSSETLYFSKIGQFNAICDANEIYFVSALQPGMGIGNKKLTSDEENLKRFFGSKFYSPSWESYIGGTKRYYANITSQLNGEWQHDLSGIFDHVEERVYSDPRHYNDHGSEIVARWAFDLIMEMKSTK